MSRRPPPPDDDRCLSIKEVCRLTNLGRTKIYAAISAGELPSFTLGRRRLVWLSDALGWLERAAQRPDEP